MNKTILSITVSLILLAAAIITTPVTLIQNTFAKSGDGRHTDSSVGQAASISNSCLNPLSNSNTNDNMISNGDCGGTISQQGKSGQASTPTTVQNANPTIEVQRSTTTPTTTQSPPTSIPGPSGPLDKNIMTFLIVPFTGVDGKVTITDKTTKKSNTYVVSSVSNLPDTFVIPVGDTYVVNATGSDIAILPDPPSTACIPVSFTSCFGTMVTSRVTLVIDAKPNDL